MVVVPPTRALVNVLPLASSSLSSLGFATAMGLGLWLVVLHMVQAGCHLRTRWRALIARLAKEELAGGKEEGQPPPAEAKEGEPTEDEKLELAFKAMEEKFLEEMGLLEDGAVPAE